MFTLSIVLNLYREGELARKTIQNLRNILQEANDWEEVEIIAVLDNTDALTRSVALDNKDLFSAIEEVTYKDLGDSRNHGVDVASKEFVVFADGDDYCSHNMLQALYEKFFAHYHQFTTLDNLSDEEHIAVFPEYLIEFPNLFQMHYSDSNDFIVQNNRFMHCFHSKIAIKKDILKKNQLRKNEEPYGYEDWDLNNRLLTKGIQYKVTDYKLYYRREVEEQSMLSKQVLQKHIVRSSFLYSADILKKEINQVDIPISHNKFAYSPKSNIVKNIYRDVIFENDKQFLQTYEDSMQYREDITHSSTYPFALKLSEQSLLYNQLLKFLQGKEIVYFVPWINLGGADKVILEYTKSIVNNDSVGVITTLQPGSRIGSLGKIEHLDLPSNSIDGQHISEEDKLHIITKALINSDVKVIHVINSDLALQTIKYYSEVYKEYNIKTLVSLFCPDYDWINNKYHGYPVMYPELFNNADMILSDNNHWYDFFKGLNDNEDFNFKKLASPTDEVGISYHPKKEDTKKILWASRICNQKLFGVFEEVVNQLPDYDFVIHGGPPEEANNIDILERLLKKNNVEFRGEYQNISELNLDEYDLYLFTSLFEGIPTIILDMAMSGIPIVTAEVGGISEVLGKNYPLLVKEQRNAQAYVDKIKAFYGEKVTIISLMKEIREYIITHHNEETFQSEYRQVMKELLG